MITKTFKANQDFNLIDKNNKLHVWKKNETVFAKIGEKRFVVWCWDSQDWVSFMRPAKREVFFTSTIEIEYNRDEWRLVSITKDFIGYKEGDMFLKKYYKQHGHTATILKPLFEDNKQISISPIWIESTTNLGDHSEVEVFVSKPNPFEDKQMDYLTEDTYYKVECLECVKHSMNLEKSGERIVTYVYDAEDKTYIIFDEDDVKPDGAVSAQHLIGLGFKSPDIAIYVAKNSLNDNVLYETKVVRKIENIDSKQIVYGAKQSIKFAPKEEISEPKINFVETPAKTETLVDMSKYDFIEVSGFPKIKQNMRYDYLINVSDEMHNLRGLHRTFWFPLNECTNDIGINSIYGALCALFLAEREVENKPKTKVLLHCHAGAFRSPLVKELYILMRNIESPIRFYPNVTKSLKFGYVPAEMKLITFLSMLNEWLESGKSMGGVLDLIKLKALRE